MKVDFNTQTSFRGYDARKLKGFLMSYNCYGIADEMMKIGEKEGFKIFMPTIVNGKPVCKKYSPFALADSKNLWSQDLWTILKGKLLAFEYSKTTQAIKEFFNLQYDFTEQVAHSTEKIKSVNQNLWDLFAEAQQPAEQRARGLDETVNEIEVKKAELHRLQDDAHIKGGNVFIVKGDNGDELFIGEEELKKYDILDMQAMYNVEKVIVLPQMDFHLDLFIRPLDKKRVLIADDNMTLKVLNEGLERLNGYINSLPNNKQGKYKKIFIEMSAMIKEFEEEVQCNLLPQTDEVAKILEDNGYETIRVPGRFYETWEGDDDETCLKHYCNYLNANVLKNRRGNLVYITNKSNIDKMLGLSSQLSKKIGFSFEQAFRDAISPYVKNSKIYFVKGHNNYVANEMLTEYQGGIHCASSEIIDEVQISD